MATITKNFDVQSAVFRTTLNPAVVLANGSNYPVPGLAFDAATDEAAFFRFVIDAYAASGNLTLKLYWYADTATSGNVVLGGTIAAISPETDTQDAETDGLATEATVTDSHLGTTGQRMHVATITISSLDSLANGDIVTLRIRRVGSNGSDTMSGDLILTDVVLTYSDT